MRFKIMQVHKHFFQSKMILDIPKEEDEDLEEKVETALTDPKVNQMKGTDWPVQLAVIIWDPDLIAGLTNQKLNAIIIKIQVIMLGIVEVQPRGLRRMQILW